MGSTDAGSVSLSFASKSEAWDCPSISLISIAILPPEIASDADCVAALLPAAQAAVPEIAKLMLDDLSDKLKKTGRTVRFGASAAVCAEEAMLLDGTGAAAISAFSRPRG